MGFFKTAAAAQSTQANAGAGESMRNVALRVMSYDVEAKTTTGVDLATNETLTIKLRDLDKPNPARLDVDEWAKERYKKKGNVVMVANPKAVVAGDEGGTLIFETVRREPDGQLTARWASVAAHDSSEADVFVALVRPATAYGSRTNADDKRAIELIRTITAKPVTTEQELRDAMTELLSRPFTSVVVRASDGDEIRSSVVWRGKDKTAEQAVDAYRTSNKELGRLLDDEAISQMTVEVFAVERIYPGKDYRQTLSDLSKLEAQRFLRDWSLGDNKGFGFSETVVALRTHDEGGQYFTMLRPTTNRPMLWPTPGDVPTANIKPHVAPVMKASAAASGDEAETAPAQAASTSVDTAVASEATTVAANDGATQTTVADKLAGAARAFGRRGA